MKRRVLAICPLGADRVTIRVIAIVWSGSRSTGLKKIWLAESEKDQLIRLENGRDRNEVADHLIAEAKRTPQMIIGLDFAFAFPGWFIQQHGCTTAAELLDLVTRMGEGWLTSCPTPFWGRQGHRRPVDQEHFRHTEHKLPSAGGIRAKSVFQINGAGAVGCGSLRGMPMLHRLRNHGFAIWPFDPPGWPRVVEIYPRVLTGPVRKSRQEERTRYLLKNYPQLSGEYRQRAISSEDAFDAAVSALVMGRRLPELSSLTQTEDPQLKLEGQIWR